MKTMKGMLVMFSVAGVAMLLHGCGGDTPAPTPAPPATTGTTTTTPLPFRTKPMTSQEAADYLNKLYLGFSEADQTTQIGVTISMAAQVSGFFANIFCSQFFNPDVNGYTTCFKGQADCRMSTSTLSHGWMTDSNTKGKLASFGGRSVGYVFNQTMVEQKWTKCSYIWDGASFRLYNRGCGDGAPSVECGPTETNAFNNKCGADLDHTCTADDDEIKRKICVGTLPGGTAPVPTRHDTEPECFFPGPAFDYHGQSDFKFGQDYTREMAKQRLKYNDGSDKEGPNTEKNNEVVLDEELLIHDIWQNPITAIPAIVYTKKTNKNGLNKKYAQGIRDDLCKAYGCEQNGGGVIPLVMIDDTQYQANGPFFADTDEDLSIAI